MNNVLTVQRTYSQFETIISFDVNLKKGKNLDDFLHKIKVIKTHDKWSTWGRYYVEVPVEVLKEFGIICNKPIVVYLNYVYNNAYYYCYAGQIFDGDAAWFDTYIEVEKEYIKDNSSYKKFKAALENSNSLEDFLSSFDNSSEKWSSVPVYEPDINLIIEVIDMVEKIPSEFNKVYYARKYNNHLK